MGTEDDSVAGFLFKALAVGLRIKIYLDQHSTLFKLLWNYNCEFPNQSLPDFDVLRVAVTSINSGIQRKKQI